MTRVCTVLFLFISITAAATFSGLSSDNIFSILSFLKPTLQLMLVCRAFYTAINFINQEPKIQKEFKFLFYKPATTTDMQLIHYLRQRPELLRDQRFLHDCINYCPAVASALYAKALDLALDSATTEDEANPLYAALLRRIIACPVYFEQSWKQLSELSRAQISQQVMRDFVSIFNSSTFQLHSKSESFLVFYTPWFIDLALFSARSYPQLNSIIDWGQVYILRFGTIRDIYALMARLSDYLKKLHRENQIYQLALMTIFFLKRWPEMPDANPFVHLPSRTYQLLITSPEHFCGKFFKEDVLIYHSFVGCSLTDDEMLFFEHILVFLHFHERAHAIYRNAHEALSQVDYDVVEQCHEPFAMVLLSWIGADADLSIQNMLRGTRCLVNLLYHPLTIRSYCSLEFLQAFTDTHLDALMYHICAFQVEDPTPRKLLVHYAAIDQRIRKSLHNLLRSLPAELLEHHFVLPNLLSGSCLVYFMIPGILCLFPNVLESIHYLFELDPASFQCSVAASTKSNLAKHIDLLKTLRAIDSPHFASSQPLSYFAFWHYWLTVNPHTLQQFMGHEFYSNISSQLAIS